MDRRNQQTESVSRNNEAFRVVNTSSYDRVSPKDMSNVSTYTVNDYINANGFNIFANYPSGGRRTRNVQFDEVLKYNDLEKARAPARTNTVSSNLTRTSVLEPLGDSRSSSFFVRRNLDFLGCCRFSQLGSAQQGSACRILYRHSI